MTFPPAAYSFVRFIGGAIAPWLAGKLAEWYAPQVPFYVGAGAVVVSIMVLYSGRRLLQGIDARAAHAPAAERENLREAIAAAIDEP